MKAITVCTAMAAVTLAPMAHADDDYVGPYDVTNCTFSWAPGTTIKGTVTSQDCVDAFLYLAHYSHLVSSPDYAGPTRTSDSQLVDDGVIACWFYRRDGYGIDRTAAQVRQIGHSLSGGKTGDPANELVTEAIISLCEGGGLREYVPGT